MAAPANPYPERGSTLFSSRFLLALALGLALLTYIQVWRFEFVYDDHFQIERNVNIRSWGRLPAYFSSQLWANTSNNLPSNYYRPLFLVWLRVNYAWFGIESSYWHASSLLLHLLASLLVYLATLKLLELAGSPEERRPPVAAIAALIFALHPVHAEAVAWVSAASELLLTIFLLAAFVCYVSASRELKGSKWTRASLVFFALALLTKETAATFVLVVAACEFIVRSHWRPPVPLAERMRATVRIASPWLAVVAGYLVVRWFALGELAHRQMVMTLGTVLKTIPELLWFYCRHLLAPYPLAVLYDVYPVDRLRSLQFLLPLAAIAAICALVWLAGRRSPSVAMAASWFLLTLLPVLNPALLRPDAWVQDRYLYLPSFGFCVLAGLGLERLLFSGRKAAWTPALLALLAAAMGVIAARASAPWENDLMLFERAVKVAPENAFAKSNLGAELMLRNENDRALQLLLAAYGRDPGAWNTAYDLGYLYYTRADLAQAEHYFQRAIEIDGNNRNQFLMLGITEKRLGKLAEAEVLLRRTAESWPEAPFVHTTLGEVLEKQGKYDDALVEFARDLSSSNPAPARAGMARVEAEREKANLREVGADR